MKLIDLLVKELPKRGGGLKARITHGLTVMGGLGSETEVVNLIFILPNELTQRIEFHLLCMKMTQDIS